MYRLMASILSCVTGSHSAEVLLLIKVLAFQTSKLTTYSV